MPTKSVAAKAAIALKIKFPVSAVKVAAK